MHWLRNENMRLIIERSPHKVSCDVFLSIDAGGGKYRLAKPAVVEFAEFGDHDYAPKEDHVLVELRPEVLRTLYECLGQELMNLGIIPRPATEGEFKMMQEQLADSRKTRDQALAILSMMSQAQIAPGAD